nr:MAG TPA: hypothetical protein [Inoviridae sp.]
MRRRAGADVPVARQINRFRKTVKSHKSLKVEGWNQ